MASPLSTVVQERIDEATWREAKCLKCEGQGVRIGSGYNDETKSLTTFPYVCDWCEGWKTRLFAKWLKFHYIP